MTNEQARKVAAELRAGRRIGAIRAIREANGSSLYDAKLAVDNYLSMEGSKDPISCQVAAVKYLADNHVQDMTFEDWFKAGIEGCYFELIKQIKREVV